MSQRQKAGDFATQTQVGGSSVQQTSKREWRFGPLDALIVVFVVLKLAGTITWPWIYVLLPLIVAVSIGIGCGVEHARSQRSVR